MGYTEEDIIGKTSIEFNIWANIEDRQKMVAGLRKDGEVTNLEAAFRTKGDNIVYGLMSSSVIDLDGVPHIFSITRDITKRKRDEEEKAKLEAQLQQAQKMESIGSLAGGIAHDLNNILFPISGLSEMLLDDIPLDTSEHKSIEQIYKSAQRGSDLVKQILSFSCQSNPQKLPIRIQPILKEVLKLARATIPWNIEITSNIKQDCGMISANPTQVHQIAMNLITNAFHAVEGNGGTINVELKETIIRHLDERDESPFNEIPPDGTSGFPIRLLAGGYACITLSDTGTGIDQTLIDKIFDPYFTTKEQGKGTGLGLSVVHGIVKEHGGDILVNSEVGKGTTFNVYLPLIKDAGNRKDAAVIEKYPTGCERILLVDDEEQIVLLEQMMLERLGYQTTVRTSSPDALAAFRANPSKFDLVICDRGMPNMTGEQLARELILIKPEIPIIICTGFCDETDAHRARTIGIKGFLMKPVAAGDLATMVRKVLDGRGLLPAPASLQSGLK
jgi:signal transduction histidine kinase/ActR/RegA family two-component response regulator